MNSVRRFADDLIEKRLWPVVVLLAIALIAIPLVIGRSGDPASAPAATIAPAAAPVAAATPAVELVGPPDVRTRAGELRDPFRRKKARVASASKPASAKPASAKSESSKDDGKTAGANKDSGSSSPAKPKAAATVPADPAVGAIARSVYETVAHVKGANRDYEHALKRLAVVGEKDTPALQYLGVSRGGEYAIFLLGPLATATGDVGACIVAQPCRAIGVRRGEKLKVEVAEPGAAPRHYSVEVTSLRRVERASEAAAQRERDHVAEDGRDMLRTLAEDLPTAGALGQLNYGPATGTVALIAAK